MTGYFWCSPLFYKSDRSQTRKPGPRLLAQHRNGTGNVNVSEEPHRICCGPASFRAPCRSGRSPAGSRCGSRAACGAGCPSGGRSRAGSRAAGDPRSAPGARSGRRGSRTGGYSRGRGSSVSPDRWSPGTRRPPPWPRSEERASRCRRTFEDSLRSGRGLTPMQKSRHRSPPPRTSGNSGHPSRPGLLITRFGEAEPFPSYRPSIFIYWRGKGGTLLAGIPLSCAHQWSGGEDPAVPHTHSRSHTNTHTHTEVCRRGEKVERERVRGGTEA